MHVTPKNPDTRSAPYETRKAWDANDSFIVTAGFGMLPKGAEISPADWQKGTDIICGGFYLVLA